MQAIIIDDNPGFGRKVAALIRAVPKVHKEEYYEKSSTYSIAEELNELASGDRDTVVFINIDLKCAGGSRQQQLGVEVLKHLRLTDNFYDAKRSELIDNRSRDLHCVMYSFLTLEQVLRRKPENFIICSHGTTFLRLPCDFARVPYLMKAKAEINSLAPYIRGELTLPDERHEWANWWGIRQLYDVHKHVTGNFKLRYPTKVQDELQRLRSKQAIYLFGYSDVEIGSAFEELRDEIVDLRTTLVKQTPRILHIDDKWEDGWSRIFTKIVYPNLSLNRAPDPFSPFEDFCLEGKPLFRVFKSFGTDEERQGTAEKRIDVICAGIKQAMNFDPDLILLDLRLFNEVGVRYEAGSLSGGKVLRWLREESHGIPVIMTTASNKVWSLEQLIQLGADAFWVKEGLDDRKTPEETVRNYVRLLQLAAIATGEKYRFLNRLDRWRLNLQETKTQHWWEKHQWNDNSTTEASRDKVETILLDTVLMLRSYLQQHEMGYCYRNKVEERNWEAAVLRNAANIIEEVHQFYASGPGNRTSAIIGGYRNKKTGVFVTRRGDWFGYELYAIRNETSHHSGAQNMSWEILTEFLASLICYLMYGPENTFRKIEKWEITGPVKTEYDSALAGLDILRKSSPQNYDFLFRRIMG